MTNSTRIWKYWLPVLIMLIIQFSFSTGSFSSDETSRYIVPILKFISPTLSGERLIFWHHVVRKAAHVTEYCILGILVYRAFQIDVPNSAMVRILTVLFVACAALLDEFHQSFVATRTSSIFDVGFDCIGGMIALVLVWGWRTARMNAE
jgi:VanZ family protein